MNAFGCIVLFIVLSVDASFSQPSCLVVVAPSGIRNGSCGSVSRPCALSVPFSTPFSLRCPDLSVQLKPGAYVDRLDCGLLFAGQSLRMAPLPPTSLSSSSSSSVGIINTSHAANATPVWSCPGNRTLTVSGARLVSISKLQLSGSGSWRRALAVIEFRLLSSYFYIHIDNSTFLHNDGYSLLFSSSSSKNQDTGGEIRISHCLFQDSNNPIRVDLLAVRVLFAYSRFVGNTSPYLAGPPLVWFGAPDASLDIAVDSSEFLDSHGWFGFSCVFSVDGERATGRVNMTRSTFIGNDYDGVGGGIVCMEQTWLHLSVADCLFDNSPVSVYVDTILGTPAPVIRDSTFYVSRAAAVSFAGESENVVTVSGCRFLAHHGDAPQSYAVRIDRPDYRFSESAPALHLTKSTFVGVAGISTIYTLFVSDCVFQGPVAVESPSAAIQSTSTVDLYNTVFDRYESTAQGGAVYLLSCQSFVSLDISNCTFSHCRAAQGGAVAASGLTFTLVVGGDTIFRSCSASNQGGALYVAGLPDVELPPDVRIGSTLFERNSAAEGGAIYLQDTYFQGVSMQAQYNRAGRGGGGAMSLRHHVAGVYDSFVFLNNSAEAGCGGAISAILSASSTLALSGRFWGNRAGANGGAVSLVVLPSLSSVDQQQSFRLLLRRSVFDKNFASGDGSAVWVNAVGSFAETTVFAARWLTVTNNVAGGGGTLFWVHQFPLPAMLLDPDAFVFSSNRAEYGNPDFSTGPRYLQLSADLGPGGPPHYWFSGRELTANATVLDGFNETLRLLNGYNVNLVHRCSDSMQTIGQWYSATARGAVIFRGLSVPGYASQVCVLTATARGAVLPTNLSFSLRPCPPFYEKNNGASACAVCAPGRYKMHYGDNDTCRDCSPSTMLCYPRQPPLPQLNYWLAWSADQKVVDAIPCAPGFCDNVNRTLVCHDGRWNAPSNDGPPACIACAPSLVGWNRQCWKEQECQSNSYWPLWIIGLLIWTLVQHLWIQHSFATLAVWSLFAQVSERLWYPDRTLLLSAGPLMLPFSFACPAQMRSELAFSVVRAMFPAALMMLVAPAMRLVSVFWSAAFDWTPFAMSLFALSVLSLEPVLEILFQLQDCVRNGQGTWYMQAPPGLQCQTSQALQWTASLLSYVAVVAFANVVARKKWNMERLRVTRGFLVWTLVRVVLLTLPLQLSLSANRLWLFFWCLISLMVHEARKPLTPRLNSIETLSLTILTFAAGFAASRTYMVDRAARDALVILLATVSSILFGGLLYLTVADMSRCPSGASRWRMCKVAFGWSPPTRDRPLSYTMVQEDPVEVSLTLDRN